MKTELWNIWILQSELYLYETVESFIKSKFSPKIFKVICLVVVLHSTMFFYLHNDLGDNNFHILFKKSFGTSWLERSLNDAFGVLTPKSHLCVILRTLTYLGNFRFSLKAHSPRLFQPTITAPITYKLSLSWFLVLSQKLSCCLSFYNLP